MIADCREFILNNTRLQAIDFLTPLKLHLADEAFELWHKTESELEEIGLPPPFWAFAWAGGQALGRYLYDHPEIVSKKRVLDLATGSGLVAICAAMIGAREVHANDLDPFSAAACSLNAEANEVRVTFLPGNVVEFGLAQIADYDVILAGDVFYDPKIAGAFDELLTSAKRAGKVVLIGDPSRHYLPTDKMSKLAEYEIPVTRELEDQSLKRTSVWQYGTNEAR